MRNYFPGMKSANNGCDNDLLDSPAISTRNFVCSLIIIKVYIFGTSLSHPGDLYSLRLFNKRDDYEDLQTMECAVHTIIYLDV